MENPKPVSRIADYFRQLTNARSSRNEQYLRQLFGKVNTNPAAEQMKFEGICKKYMDCYLYPELSYMEMHIRFMA